MCAHTDNSNLDGGEAKASRRSNAGRRAHWPASISPWQKERAKILLRICVAIQRRTDKGQNLHKAAVYFAWYWRNRFYRYEPKRRIQLSTKTILRIFYQWRNSGQNAAALALRYTVQPSRVTAARLRRFVKCCLTPGVRSYAAAHQLAGDFAVSVDTYQKAIPAQLRRRLTKLFCLERLTQSRRASLRRAQNDFKGVLKASPRISKPEFP